MSFPETDEERAQYERTSQCARPSENVVSTACPECGVRFSMLARYNFCDGWRLRCILCGHSRRGELKTASS